MRCLKLSKSTDIYDKYFKTEFSHPYQAVSNLEVYVVFETEDCSGSLKFSMPRFVSRHVTSLGDFFGIFSLLRSIYLRDTSCRITEKWAF